MVQIDVPHPAAPPLCTVLCIEDHPVHMDVVEALLSRFAGIRLVKACTGRDGVRLAHAEHPDLVLLDMNLPDISGLDVVRELSVLISQRGLRIVLLTADSLSIDVVKALSLGAHDYWAKPIDVEHVTARLTRLLDELTRRRGMP
jgi:DNA-binding response OmpR family regulator